MSARLRRATGALQHANVLTIPLTNEVLAKCVRNGGTLGVGTIPKDAVITRTVISITEASDDGTATTIQIGTPTDPDFLLAGTTDLATPGQDDGAITAPTLYDDVDEVILTFAGAGDATTGKAVFFVEYLRPDGADGVS